MGYHTRYSLEVIQDEYTFIDHEAGIGQASGYGNPFGDECKWCNHDKHMLEYSLDHPNVLFKLSGEGEEAGDLWIKYYKNGKMQECRAAITYPPFDESKLE